jgi:ribosome maturation factor RimP
MLQLEEELDEFLYDFGFQLVDFVITGKGPLRIYRVMFEHVGDEKLSIDDCSSMAPQVRLFLEMKGVYNDRSSLELSSGGLDRVLKRERDFEKYLGREVKVRYFDGQSKVTIKGQLASFTDRLLMIAPTDGGETVKVERGSAEKVNLVPKLEF